MKKNKKWIRCYLDHIGFAKNEYPIARQVYCYGEDKDVVAGYRQYLQDLSKWHQDRQSSVESKNSQVIGQVSVVISIVTLFIPLIIANVGDLAIGWTIFIVALLLVLLFHFSLAIIHATKMLEADKNRYMTGSTRTVTKPDRAADALAFQNAEIADMVHMINVNNAVTNRLTANLVYASRCFKIGIIGFGVYCCILLAVFLNKNPSKPQQVKVTSPVSVNIQRVDSLVTTRSLHETVQQLRDEMRLIQQCLDSLSSQDSVSGQHKIH